MGPCRAAIIEGNLSRARGVTNPVHGYNLPAISPALPNKTGVREMRSACAKSAIENYYNQNPGDVN